MVKDRILLRGRPLARAIVLGTMTLAAAAMVYGAVVEPRQLHMVPHSVGVNELPADCEGVRIDLVSDIHTGSLNNGVDNLDRLVGDLKRSDADVVLLAGDYVILSVLGGTYVSGATVAQHLQPLARQKPTYAVLGNHDWWKNGQQIAQDFRKAGIHMTDNRAVRMQVRQCEFWLVGIGDKDEGHPDIAFALEQTRSAPNLPKIALTHNPELFEQIPEEVGLTLAGHTHGGQIRVPIGGYPAFWFKPKAESTFVDGLYREPDGRALFVTRGVGTSIVSLRFGVPPEVSQLTLRRATQAR